MIFVRCFFQNKNTTWRGLLEMKKCFSFLLALTLMLAVCAAASAETITLKIAHNYDFVTIPNSVIAAADRLNERYAAEGKDIKIEFEKDYQRIDWGEYGQNLIFAYKNGDCPDIFSVSDVPTMAAVGIVALLALLGGGRSCGPVHQCFHAGAGGGAKLRLCVLRTLGTLTLIIDVTHSVRLLLWDRADETCFVVLTIACTAQVDNGFFVGRASSKYD